jgi:hypothetical protein
MTDIALNEAIVCEEPLQAVGSHDPLTDEYCLSLASGSLLVTFHFLTRDQVEHIKSCIDCMLMSSEIESNE